MKSRLRELLEERERRRKRPHRRRPGPKSDKPVRTFDTSNLCAGEIANLLEGLTPDGYDKAGRKVSFVETGRPLRRRGISDSLRGFWR